MLKTMDPDGHVQRKLSIIRGYWEFLRCHKNLQYHQETHEKAVQVHKSFLH